MIARRLLPFAMFAILVAAVWLQEGSTVRGQTPRLSFENEQRIVLLGGTGIERLQAHGYLETWITACYPHRNLSFRNLGWSGDTVFGTSRALFGTEADGFKRLVKDVTEAKPSVILIQYGANEANEGPAGVSHFEQGLERLLDTLASTKARLVLVSPLSRIRSAGPLPDPATYNRHLALYSERVKVVAAKRKLLFIDLQDVLERVENRWELSDNSLHLNRRGHWAAAPRIARKWGIAPDPWQVFIDADTASYDAQGCAIHAFEQTPEKLRLTILDRVLPYPSKAPSGTQPPPRASILRVKNLPPGTYQLRIDGQVQQRASARLWSEGVALEARGGSDQFTALLAAISRKNELYFHRHRPQNETYLFLFRKHEQGNNAVEIPQFDPLILEQETQIARLRRPQPHLYELELSTR